MGKAMRMNKRYMVFIFLFVTHWVYAQVQTDSIKPIRLWDYRHKFSLEPKLKDLGPGYLHNGKIYKLTLQASLFNKLMKTCDTLGEVFDVNQFRAISRKNTILTVSSFIGYAFGAILLVNTYDEPTQMLAVFTGGVGLTLFFVGSVRLVRKTNKQRQMFFKGIEYYNANCLRK